MSMYAVVDDAEPADIASNSGWAEFCRWADELDADEFGQIVHLREYGWSQRAGDLLEQLRASEPPTPDVQDVVDSLAAAADGADIVSITNGMSAVTPGGGSAATSAVVRGQPAAGRTSTKRDRHAEFCERMRRYESERFAERLEADYQLAEQTADHAERRAAVQGAAELGGAAAHEGRHTAAGADERVPAAVNPVA